MGVNRGGFGFGMAQQFLYESQIYPVLDLMCGIAMAEGIGVIHFSNPGADSRRYGAQRRVPLVPRLKMPKPFATRGGVVF